MIVISDSHETARRALKEAGRADSARRRGDGNRG